MHMYVIAVGSLYMKDTDDLLFNSFDMKNINRYYMQVPFRN